MANYGLKISNTGYDVKTSTDIQTSMSSKYNSLKVLAQGALALSVAPTNTYSTDISHSLGYTPAFLVFSDSVVGGGKRFQLPFNDGVAYATADAYTTTTNLHIDTSTGGFSGTGTLNQYYYIFVDNSGA